MRPRCCSISARRFRRKRCICRAPITSSASTRCRIARRVLGSLQSLLDHGRLGKTGYVSILPVDQGIEHSAGASFAPNPMYFDPGKHRQAGHRRRLQRRGVDARRARIGGAEIRAQDSVPHEVQPQRVPLVSEHVRPDQVRQRQAGVRHGREGGGRDDLFRLGRIEAADRRSVRDVPAGPRARDVHGAVVLPAQPGVQDQGRGLSRVRPTSPARPTTWA